MGFDGLIITDSLGMEDQRPPRAGARRGLQGGADILLNPPDVDLAYNAVLEAVKR